MPQLQALIGNFRKRRPLVNIVLDGFGLGKQDRSDGVFLANTPFFDGMRRKYANTVLAAHGKHVGLPGEKDLGGSEVGHLTMGAGIIVDQGSTIINDAIQDGTFYERPVLRECMQSARKGALHLIGLLSDGNVHSHLSHFIAVIEHAARRNVSRCYVHALLDGRDVGIQTADIYIRKLLEIFHKVMVEHPDWDYGIASAGGRECITMDRDQNWDKVKAGWDTHVKGLSQNNFGSALEAIEHFRQKRPDLIDQDCPQFNVYNREGRIPTIKDGDTVLFMNFRADRAIEITRAFVEENFNEFDRGKRPDVYFAGMTVYDEDNNIPENRIIGSPVVELPFGKRILELGLHQFRLAETQKYAHVTFFFNGGYRNPLDADRETYCLIDSDKVASFAEAPKMKAAEIGKKAVEFIRSGRYDFGLINFANADMVGHTGDMKATIKAVEAVDAALETICDAVAERGGVALVTADHGNADEMLIYDKKGREEICTKHSINPVPLVVFDPKYDGSYRLKENREGERLNLSMIAATNFILLGLPVPAGLNGHLFELP